MANEHERDRDRRSINECRCEKCGREMVPASSGRGDTYCTCEEEKMTPEERERYQRWIDGLERR